MSETRPQASHPIASVSGGAGQIASVGTDVEGAHLVLSLEDGRTTTIEAHELWCACPSAAGRRRRFDGCNQPPCGLTITKLQPIGHYAVNVGFSDGHDRGIYPWHLLLDLSRRPKADDFILPA